MPDSKIIQAPDEPLALSAPVAWHLAAQHCNRDAATGETCAWNHGLWQFLRLMGLAGTAAHRGAFYKQEIRAFAAENSAPRILISGTTDYAMLAQVLAAFAGLDTTPSVTVLDICETPLRLNVWYAERASHRIQTAHSDILAYESTEQFDLICTDSFLARFPHAQWPQLIARWHALLRPGGRLLTASRLRPGPGPVCMKYDAAQITAFRERVVAHADHPDLRTMIGREELVQAAERFGRHQLHYPLRSERQLEELLNDAGFDLDGLQADTCTTEKRERTWVPLPSSNGKYVYVVAKRRQSVY